MKKFSLSSIFVAVFVLMVTNVFAAVGDVVPLDKNATPLPNINSKKVVAGELTFTFNSPDSPWTTDELSKLRNWVVGGYPVMKRIFGNPAETAVINIGKNINIVGGRSAYPEITIGTLAADVVFHEILHSFSGQYGIFAGTYREGMVVAATGEVMKSFPDEVFADRNHSGQQSVMYEQANSESIGMVDGNFQNGFSNLGLRYIQSGYAWSKILLEDPRFLIKFNSRYYADAKANPSLFLDLVYLKNLVKSLKTTVEGMAFDLWYEQQEVFNTNPAQGMQLVYSAGNFAVMFFVRDAAGIETMQKNAIIHWVAYDCWSTSIDSGIAVTDDIGWAQIPVWNLGSSYQGKINLNLNVTIGDQNINRSVSIPSVINGVGVFGTSDVCTGTVDLDPPSGKTQHTQIVNGMFSFPNAMRAGTYTLKNGSKIKKFTKDASNYFTLSP